MGTAIGIFAHVDAGKTTLSEQILYKGGALRQIGRVDHQDAFLDHSELERTRGITIFADESPFSVNKHPFYLIDTPGHVDFSGEMERSILAIDCAVLVISCVEGVQSHTETIWRILRQHHVPTILFLNKADRDIADPDRVLSEVRQKWDGEFVVFDEEFHTQGMTDTLAQELASCDEALLEHYLAHSADSDFTKQVRVSFQNNILFPIVVGSALNGSGVDILFALWVSFCPSKSEDNAPFQARVYKIRHEKSGGRVAFLKILSGVLRAKDTVLCSGSGDECLSAKINELRSYSGGKFVPLTHAAKGDICAVTGLSDVMPGDIVGMNANRSPASLLQPLMSAAVLFDSGIPVSHRLSVMREIEDEEPLLHVDFNEITQQIRVQIMGEIQIQILTNILSERFGLTVNFGECEILYKETIQDTVIGCGHFEPLRHYAEVHLELSPAPRGSGISFESRCPTDELALNWQRLIETHVFERNHCGVLTGAPLTDVHITLLAGAAHIKHTEGGDFREATYRAIRQGLMQAKSLLLEPWFGFEIEVDIALCGHVLTDIQKMGGRFDPPLSRQNIAVITGLCPVSSMQSYARDFMVMTRGKGKLNLHFDDYYPCEKQAEIIAQKGYDPERDIENTPDSVFCSHGAGYPVKWHDATAMMHLKIH